MQHLSVRILNRGETMPTELQPPPGTEVIDGTIEHFVVIQDGTVGGLAAVLLDIALPDGKRVAVQTTANLFHMAASAVRGACHRWGQTL